MKVEMPTIDPEAIRAAMTPYKAGLYFNNAAASLMPHTVLNAVTNHLARESAKGAYGAASEVADQLADLYSAASQLLGCDSDEVAVTDSHSRGWGAAIGAMRFNVGDRILVSRGEWGGNYAALVHIARSRGALLEIIPSDDSGAVCLEQLEAMLDERVRLIALTWLPANGGLVNPAAQVGALARAAGIAFVLDAAQAVGQMPVNVQALGCDVLTAPGRKWLRGPRGTGLLYVRRSFLTQLDPPAVDHFSAPWTGSEYRLRNDARRFETSEASVALRLGLRAAIRGALELGLDAIQYRIVSLAEALRSSLAAIESVQVHDLGRQRSGLVSFTVNGVTPAQVRELLQDAGIEVAVSGVAFTPLDMQARGLTDLVRASPHLYTTQADIDQLAVAVSQIVRHSKNDETPAATGSGASPRARAGPTA
ncbi:MAG TPA: aminotransferase class V-fold PLP-dependent enzyme [Lysobacter sp.]|nr:aminotransferase class V-fold PLP-dependent enzyme [Lysobacter sp.]